MLSTSPKSSQSVTMTSTGKSTRLTAFAMEAIQRGNSLIVLSPCFTTVLRKVVRTIEREAFPGSPGRGVKWFRRSARLSMSALVNFIFSHSRGKGARA